MKFVIKTNDENSTIKDFLRKNKISSNLLKRLKKLHNGITVNSEHQNVTYVLKENDILELNIDDFDEDENKFLMPADIPVEIIFENDDVTVVNKPSNMPTHESLNNRGNSLANALKYRYREKIYVFRATNRLDKDTSGVVITANNRYFASLMSNKIKNNEVEKTYLAVVSGKLIGEGVINAPIDRVGKSIIKRMVREDGEEAITYYKSLLSSDMASLILLTPRTGRTHQLRVHMAHINHPIIGDTLYGCESEHINRQALHCYKMDVLGVGCYEARLFPDMRELINFYFKDDIASLKEYIK